MSEIFEKNVKALFQKNPTFFKKIQKNSKKFKNFRKKIQKISKCFKKNPNFFKTKKI